MSHKNTHKLRNIEWSCFRPPLRLLRLRLRNTTELRFRANNRNKAKRAKADSRIPAHNNSTHLHISAVMDTPQCLPVSQISFFPSHETNKSKKKHSTRKLWHCIWSNIYSAHAKYLQSERTQSPLLLLLLLINRTPAWLLPIHISMPAKSARKIFCLFWIFCRKNLKASAAVANIFHAPRICRK